MKDFIPIGNRKIPSEYKTIPHADLEFYVENPRVHSLLMSEDTDPTQEDIENALIKMPHVLQLKKEIEQFGGLAEPVYVKDGKTKIVLEGNSRLAAYRLLSKEDPLKWNKMRCQLLKDIKDSEVFQLLGLLHINGKNDWDPYEQAGFFYRRHKTHGVSKTDLGKQLSMSAIEVGKLIEVYEFMQNKKLLSKQFSHCNVYLRNKKIKHVRENNSGFDNLIINKINSGEIPEARALRDDLPKICEKGGKVLNRFIQESLPFDDAVDASEIGDFDKQIKKIGDFQKFLVNIEEDIFKLKGEPRTKCAQQILKVRQKTDELIKKLKK
tara:strand:+ start:375 stop:1343 length:969 start_codon:yes stop_codon:yes gene_type:complete